MDDLARQMLGISNAPSLEQTPQSETTLEGLQAQIADLQKENDALKRQVPQKSTQQQEIDALFNGMRQKRGRMF